MLNNIKQLVELLEPTSVSALLFVIMAQINGQAAEFSLESCTSQHNIISAIVNLSKNLSTKEFKQLEKICIASLSEENEGEMLIKRVQRELGGDFEIDNENGDSLPYPSVTKEYLDKQLNSIQRKHENYRSSNR